ncbi:MAG: phospholipase D family protein [Pseudoalteromonas nigrifaciens]
MRYLSAISLCLFMVISMLFGCASYPKVQAEPSYAFSKTQNTSLAKGIALEASKHPASSGFYLLGDGLDAFATRLLLIEKAEMSIDVQYYLFHNDTTAKIFTHYLLRAADRGVRVRMLLDDFGHESQDALFSALVQHPNVSVRLFNPFSNRTLPYVDFLTNFKQINRRMHNKSFIVDNQAAIIGGRNIGDTYFSANIYTNFSDLDVLGVGEFAPRVATAFDLYWNHSLSVAIKYIAPASSAAKLEQVRKQLAKIYTSEQSKAYLRRLESLDIIDNLLRGQLALYWANSELVYDHPDKIMNVSDDNTGYMAPALSNLLNAAHSEALIVSPYFIPGDAGVASLKRWINTGANVTILTNSLSANDVPVVHAGYANYRESLIEAGVKLWELRATVKPKSKPKIKSKDKTKHKKITDLAGSSKASLHAKTMIFDRNTLFVGSMNLDPRSINLNTEIGVVIYSDKMASTAADIFLEELPRHAWRLDVTKTENWWGFNHDLLWLDESITPTKVVSKNSEPEASTWVRFQAWLFGYLPVEHLL